MSVDTISDFLTAIRNVLAGSKRSVTVPFSTMKMGIANVLKSEGYIKDYRKIDAAKGKGRSSLVLDLKYVGGESVIHEIKLVSTPGRRYYSPVRDIKPIIGGLGISILSTNRGILTDREARRLSVGGEVICKVW